jgi:hypothetical protein
VPTDPAIRRAAYGLAAHQLQVLRRWRTVSTSSCAVVIAAYSYLSIEQSPWNWLGVAFVAAALVGAFWQRARLQRRAELLRPDNG